MSKKPMKGRKALARLVARQNAWDRQTDKQGTTRPGSVKK